MDKKEIYERYKFAKINIQMEEASLESVNIHKETDNLEGDYINEITFGKKVENVDNNSAKGYLKTSIVGRHVHTHEVELKVEVVYSGDFKAKESMEPTQIERWVDIQLVPQLLSYSRSLITSITAQMNIPPIYLPTMDVLDSIGENEKAESMDEE